MCAAPPSGNQQLVSRIFKRSAWRALKITWAFITKSYTRSPAAARDMFFSPDLPEDDLARYTYIQALNPNLNPLNPRPCLCECPRGQHHVCSTPPGAPGCVY